MQKKKIVSKMSAAGLAGIMGMSTLMPSISAAAATLEIDRSFSGLSVMSGKTGYLYVNKTKDENGKQKGVAGEKLRLNNPGESADNIVMFKTAGESNWGICVRPSLTSGYNNNTSASENDEYWDSLDDRMKDAIGRIMYYGYPHICKENGWGAKSQEARAYFIATQMMVWEVILGYRDSTGETALNHDPGTASLLDYYNKDDAVKTAYKNIEAKLAKHYKVPTHMFDNPRSVRAYNPDKTVVMEYDFATNGYSGKFPLAEKYLEDWVKPTTAIFDSMVKQWNADKSVNAKVTVTDSSKGGKWFTFTADKRPFSSSSICTSDKIETKVDSEGLADSWVVYSVSKNHQSMVFKGANIDPASGYVGIAVPNYANLRIEKTFEKDGKTVSKEKAIAYASAVSFTIRTSYEGKDYYVQADEDENGRYVFSGTTTVRKDATEFKIVNPESNISDDGTLTTAVLDLPAESDGRTYTIREYVDPTSQAAKDGYPVYNDTNVYEENVEIAGYKDGTDPTNKNQSTMPTSTVTFTNAIAGDYTSIGLKKYKRSDDNETSVATGSFIAFVNYNGKIYFLKNLNQLKNPLSGTTLAGQYKIPDNMIGGGTFLNSALEGNTSVLTTDIGYAQHLSTSSAGTLRISNCPIGLKFGFIEIKAEGMPPVNGYGDDVINNKVNWSDFENTIKTYTSEKDGVLVWDIDEKAGQGELTGEALFQKGREYLFTYGSTSMTYARYEILYNAPYYVGVKVQKKDENGEPLAGAWFALYKDGEEIERKKTGEDGIAAFDYKFTFDKGGYLNIKESDGYTYKEVEAPNGYKEDDTEYPVTFSVASADILSGLSGMHYALLKTIEDLPEVVNTKYQGEIHLLKTDAETDEAMPDIAFELTANKDLTKEEIANIKVINGKNAVMATENVAAGQVFCTIETDDNGLIDISNLPVGQEDLGKFEYSYTATEVELPVGFYGVGPYTFDFYTSNYNKERSSALSTPILYASRDALNSPEYIGINVTKKDNHNKPLAGVEFSVYAEEDVVLNGRTVQKKGDLIGTIITDATGNAKNYELLENDTYDYKFKVYGGFKYSLVETKVPDGIVLDSSKYEFTAPFDESGDAPEFTYTKTNRWNKARVMLTKVDSDTGDLLDGAVFELWQDIDKNGEFDANTDIKLDVALNNNGNGVYESAEELEYGSYFIKEVEAPEGYVVDPTAYHFNIEEDGATVTIGNYTDENGNVLFQEDKMKGSVELIKVDAETKERLSGAEFTIYNDVNENGELDESDTEYGTLTEDAEDAGVYRISEVPYGKYVVKETVTPNGFNPDESTYAVTITQNNEVITIRNNDDGTFGNAPMHGSIKLLKFDKDYPDNKLSGAEFVVYKDLDGNGIIDDNDTFIGNMIEGTDENAGIYSIMGLRMGNYLVKETVAPEGFNLDENTYSVILQQDGQEVFVENEAGKGFANSPSLGKITLTKRNSRFPDRLLSGAEFEVYKDVNKNGEVDDEDEKMGLLAETETGIYTMENLRLGNYIVHETKAPEGFNLDEEYYVVSITKNGEVVEVINRKGNGNSAPGFYNDETPTTFELTKIDLVTSAPLPNAGIRLYDENMKILVEDHTDANGKIVFKDLLPGTYYYQEFEAPEGYKINDELFKLTITGDGKILKANMPNEIKKAPVHITKTDISGSKALPNAGIAIYKEDGTFVASKYTDENGEVKFEEIPYGKYYFVEFDAPEGYLLNTEKHPFEVLEDGKVIKDTLTDELIPKTGVNDSMALPILLSATSAMGLAAITILAVGKKKRED